jgi:predicted O-methyltransferase YrrM
MRSPFNDSAKFREQLETIENIPRNDILLRAASDAKLDGLVLEFGVASGYTINILADALPDKTIYGFDSFEGLPEAWNSMGVGCFAGEIPVVRDNVELRVGVFADTVPTFNNEIRGDISLLHIDSDLYSSAKTVFDILGDRIKSGTVIVFDELCGYVTWEDHEFKALNEFLEERNLVFEIRGVDHLRFEQVHGIIL